MTPGRRAEARRQGGSPAPQIIDCAVVLVSICLLTFSCASLKSLMDCDIWLHLRTGQWILENKAVPARDVFSAHALGQPWIAYTWLFDLLVYRLWSVAGGRGLMGMIVTGSIASMVWLTGFFRRFVSLARAATLSALCFLVFLPLQTPRPWLFTIVFMIVELSLLWVAREENRPALLIPLIPLFALWANLHIQFIYGIGLMGLFALDLSAPDSARRALGAELRPPMSGGRMWGVLGACVVSTCFNPYGVRLYSVVLEYARPTSAMSYIEELHAMAFRRPWDWIVLGMVLMAAFLLGKARFKSPLLISLVAVSCFFGFRSQRDIWFPAIVAALVIASETRLATPPARVSGYFSAVAGLSFMFGLCFVAFSSRFSDEAYRRAIQEHYPEGAVQFIRTHRLRGPLYNSFSWGDYLIWRLPGLLVSIDGRSNLYDSKLAEAVATEGGRRGWAEDPDLRKARVVVVEREAGLASVLRIDGRYRLLYEDGNAVVFEPADAP